LQYPKSHHGLILTKIRHKIDPIYKDFIACYMTKVRSTQAGGEFICYGDFKHLLTELLGNEIVEQEIVTLCRHFAVEPKKSPREHREQVRSIVQGEIYRELWDDMDRLKEYLYHMTPEKMDFLTDQQCMTTIRACKIPLDIAIIKQLFTVLNRNACGEIDVCDLLSFLDLKACRAAPVPPINPKIKQFNFDTYEQEGSIIDWKQFIDAIGLEGRLQVSGD